MAAPRDPFCLASRSSQAVQAPRGAPRVVDRAPERGGRRPQIRRPCRRPLGRSSAPVPRWRGAKVGRLSQLGGLIAEEKGCVSSGANCTVGKGVELGLKLWSDSH